MKQSNTSGLKKHLMSKHKEEYYKMHPHETIGKASSKQHEITTFFKNTSLQVCNRNLIFNKLVRYSNIYNYYTYTSI